MEKIVEKKGFNVWNDHRLYGTTKGFWRGQWCWVTLALLVLSSLAIIPVALPSASANPYTGPEPTPTNLTVFLHNSALSQPITGGIFSSNLTTTQNDTASPWAGSGGIVVGLHYLDMGFYLFPRLAGPLTLNGTPVANIFVNQTGSVSSVTWTFTLYAIDTSGAKHQLGTPGTASTGLDDGSVGKSLRIPYGSSLLTTVPAGWSLLADFNQYTSGATADHYGIWWGDVGGAYYEADINLPASTYLAINQTYLTMGGKMVGALSTTVPTPVVNLTANISDPLGNYDYINWSVDWNIHNVTGILMANGTMKATGPVLPPAFNAYNETYGAPFNYSKLPPGQYTFCANATDNTYHNDLSFAGNYYGRNAQGCSSFFVGSAPNLLVLHVVDSKGAPLVGAHVRVSGILNLTNGTGDTRFHLANGSYNATVIWEGIVVANPTVLVNGTTSLVIRTQVYDPTFSIVDQAGVALSNALVYIVHPNGTHYPLLITGTSGNLSFSQVPVGNYGITVIWHDSVVYSQPAEPVVTVTNNSAYPVVTQVYYQEFQVIEPSGSPIPLSSVLVQNSTTGVLLSFGITNTSGMTTSRVPSGTFTIEVYWQTSLIATVPNLRLPATNPYVITASLFSVTFEALDSRGVAVSNAVIGVTGAGGSITNIVTNGSGGASVVLPGGTYTFTTSWEGIVVNTTTVKVSASMSLTLDLAIYYVSFSAVDSHHLVVADAAIQWGSTAGQANGSATTNASGGATVRLPGATYAISASWEGVTVNSTSLTVSSSETITLDLSVYYLTFLAVDAHGLPVSGVAITWASQSGNADGSVSTNLSGEAMARLPGTGYSVSSVWEGVLVNQTSGTLGTNTQWTLHLNVFYLSFLAVDVKGAAVGDATILLSLNGGQLSLLLLTVSNGSAVARVPVGNYSISANWEGVSVYSGGLAATQDATVTLDLEVYYLTISTVDKSGAPLPGVFLQVLSASTGTAMDSTTTTSIPAVFRLPIGSYAIVGTYKSTYDLTPVQQTVNQSVSLSASSSVTLSFSEVNPAFTSTNEFYAILGLVLLAVVIVLLLYLLLRKKKSGTSSPKAPGGVPDASKPEPKGESKAASEPVPAVSTTSQPEESAPADWKEAEK